MSFNNGLFGLNNFNNYNQMQRPQMQQNMVNMQRPGTPKILGSFFSAKTKEEFNIIPLPQGNGQHIIYVEDTQELYMKNKGGEVSLIIKFDKQEPQQQKTEETMPEDNSKFSKQLKSQNMKIVNLDKKFNKLLEKLKDKNLEVSDV